MKFDYSYISDKGGRTENQDQYGQVIASNGRSACFVVADGLGGHQGGQIAASVAVGTILEEFSRADLKDVPLFLANALTTANGAICAEQQKDRDKSQMRSTCAVLVIHKGLAWWAHVGDTRVYHFIGNVLMDRTKDHSVVQMMVDMGDLSPEEMRGHAERNRIIRSLGNPESFSPTVHAEGVPVTNATSFVLCTDGFWELVLEDELETLLRRRANAKAVLDTCEKRITAKLRPESDNYTAQIIRFPNAPKPDRLPRKPKDRSKSSGIFTNRIALLAASALAALLLVLLLVLGIKTFLKPAQVQNDADKAQADIEQTLPEADVNLIKEYASDCYQEIERLQTLIEENPDSAQENRTKAKNITKTCLENANQTKGQMDRQLQLLQEAEQKAQSMQTEANNTQLVHDYAQNEYDQAESTLKSALELKSQGKEITSINERLNTLEEAKKRFEQAANHFDTALQIAKNKPEEAKKTPPPEIEAQEKAAPTETKEVHEGEGEKEAAKSDDTSIHSTGTDKVKAAKESADNAKEKAQSNGAGNRHSYWGKAQKFYNTAKISDPATSINEYQQATVCFEAAAAQARVDKLLQEIPPTEPKLKDLGINELIKQAESAKDPSTAKEYFLKAETFLNTILKDLGENKPKAAPKVSAGELKAAKRAAENAKEQAEKDAAWNPIEAGDRKYTEAQKLENTNPEEAKRLYEEAKEKYSTYLSQTGEPKEEPPQDGPVPEISPTEPGEEEKASGQEAALSPPHDATEAVSNNAVSENSKEQEEEPFKPNLRGNRRKTFGEKILGR